MFFVFGNNSPYITKAFLCNFEIDRVFLDSKVVADG
jgi:hypothetical protein